jgi:DNA polymerase II small subunit
MVQKRKEEVVREFAQNGLLLTSHGFEKLLDCNLDCSTTIKAAKEKRQWLVSKEFLVEFFELECKKIPEEVEVRPAEKIEVTPAPGPTTCLEEVKEPEPPKEAEPPAGLKPLEVVVSMPTRKIFAKEVESRLVIDKSSDVTGKSTCEGKLEDFVDYFNEKYSGLKKIIMSRDSYAGVLPIENVKKYRGEVSHFVGMVKEKRESKKGFRFIVLEDPTGEINVLVPKDNDVLNRIYDLLLPDQVIGVQGKLGNGNNGGDLFIAQDIVEPDIPLNRKINYADEPVHAVLLSDIHVGSNLFLEKEFERFVDWLNLKGEETEKAALVKYILVAGDLVDGVGIYPGQERELLIPDIYKQYDYLAKLLEGVPDYIEVVLAMGNHDASRNAEPQPALSNELGGKLYDMNNLHMTGNPVSLSMHGVQTLMYHGTTMDTLIAKIPGCSYQNPETAMIEFIKKRHLAPMYGEDSISPEKRDYMTIRDVPDIFHAGHVHTNGYATYRGVKIINSGTWQGRTKYQEQLGHMPTPARVPIINLQNHELSVIHFGNE